LQLIKEVTNHIVTPLQHLINLSLTTGIVSSSLKIAKEIPVYKKDDSNLVGQFSQYQHFVSSSIISKNITLSNHRNQSIDINFNEYGHYIGCCFH